MHARGCRCALFYWPEEDRAWRYAVAGFFAAFAACCDLPAASFAAALLVMLLVHSPRKTLLWLVPAAAIPVVAFFVCNYLAIGQLTPAYGELEGPWYAYAGSNFNPEAAPELRRGVDWAHEKEAYATYLFHFFIGHHGVFSLTPVWLLSVAGVVMALLPGYSSPLSCDREPRVVEFRVGRRGVLAGLTLVISAVVVFAEGGTRTWRPNTGLAG